MSTTLIDWIAGRLSDSERIWSAISPLLVLLAYLTTAGILYLIRNRTHGHFHDEEMDARASGALTSRALRHFFAWTMRPWWKALARVRFPPNGVTLLALVVALGAGVGVAAGRFALGGWLFVLAGALDFLDGRLARSIGGSSPGGAALDSVLDRYVESAFLTGLCWYYREDWVLAPCLLALSGSLLVPYVRARGEALGVQTKDVGLVQRPERVLLLGVGTALSPVLEVLVAPGDPHPAHWLSIVAVVVLGVGAHTSAMQRLLEVLRTLRGNVASPSRTGGRSLRSALANIAATAADFAVATTLYGVIALRPSLSTAAGCAVGAVVSFTLSRRWAFEAMAGHPLPQSARYGAVSVVTMTLNAGGVALLLLLHTPFVVAWGLTRCVVFAAWSYPVQRDFVFAVRPGTAPPALLGTGSTSVSQT